MEGHREPKTWPLDSNRLLTSFYTHMLRPPSTPTLPPYYYHSITTTLLLPPVILLPARKKLLKTGQILGIRNIYTHSVIASEQMSN